MGTNLTRPPGAAPVFRVGDERLVKLTTSAAQKVASLLAKQGRPRGVLRVAVVGGGCSGLQYKMDLQEAPPAAISSWKVAACAWWWIPGAPCT